MCSGIDIAIVIHTWMCGSKSLPRETQLPPWSRALRSSTVVNRALYARNRFEYILETEIHSSTTSSMRSSLQPVGIDRQIHQWGKIWMHNLNQLKCRYYLNLYLHVFIVFFLFRTYMISVFLGVTMTRNAYAGLYLEWKLLSCQPGSRLVTDL